MPANNAPHNVFKAGLISAKPVVLGPVAAAASSGGGGMREHPVIGQFSTRSSGWVGQ